jgi:broad specificity phosphatase PhoE
MNRSSILFLFVFCVGQAYAQQDITTFILVRHAEKLNDGTKDPDLSDAGKKRAELLTTLLKRTKIDAIYTTAYKRSRNTVVPLAVSKGLGVTAYDPADLTEIDRIFEQWRGGTVVLCGHSNTIPLVINYLTEEKEKVQTFADDEYSNLVIVLLSDRHRAKVTWLTY